MLPNLESVAVPLASIGGMDHTGMSLCIANVGGEDINVHPCKNEYIDSYAHRNGRRESFVSGQLSGVNLL